MGVHGGISSGGWGFTASERGSGGPAQRRPGVVQSVAHRRARRPQWHAPRLCLASQNGTDVNDCRECADCAVQAALEVDARERLHCRQVQVSLRLRGMPRSWHVRPGNVVTNGGRNLRDMVWVGGLAKQLTGQPTIVFGRLEGKPPGTLTASVSHSVS